MALKDNALYGWPLKIFSNPEISDYSLFCSEIYQQLSTILGRSYNTDGNTALVTNVYSYTGRKYTF